MTTIEQAISHYKYGISHDIFREPVTIYAQLSIEALEKQIPKKVVSYSDDESDHVYCPCCHECIGSNDIVYDDFYCRGWAPMYCQECGQAMIWRQINMNEYEQILQKAKEQGLNFDGKDIIIPIAENKLMLNGEVYFGRVFDCVAYVFRYVDEQFSEKGFCSEPFLYRIVDKYSTWIVNGSMTYRIEFCVVE